MRLCLDFWNYRSTKEAETWDIRRTLDGENPMEACQNYKTKDQLIIIYNISVIYLGVKWKH